MTNVDLKNGQANGTQYRCRPQDSWRGRAVQHPQGEKQKDGKFKVDRVLLDHDQNFVVLVHKGTGQAREKRYYTGRKTYVK